MNDVIDLDTHSDARGKLTVVERLPFEIKRVYWLHHISDSAVRGGHAHRKLKRLMVAAAGSFTVEVRNAREYKEIVLSDPARGLLIAPMEWINVRDFAPGSVCLVLASDEHDESDCIRDFSKYFDLVNHCRIGDELAARGDL